MIDTTKIDVRNITMEDRERILRELPISGGIIKLVCGISNSLAYIVMGNARDKMREWKRYKFKLKQEFERSFTLYEDYQRRLLYPSEGQVRFFHVADITNEFWGKMKDDLTDAEYFEFWTSISGPLYDKVWPFVTCLAHKYYRTMKDREVKDAEYLQWPLAAMSVLELACSVYQNTLLTHEKEFKIPMHILKEVMEPFDLTPVLKQYEKALVSNTSLHFKLEHLEQRNIEMTLKQLENIVTDQDLLLKSVQGTIEAFGTEVFKTKGTVKKIMGHIDDLIHDVQTEKAS